MQLAHRPDAAGGANEDNVAFHMIQLGEVSAGRQALHGASLATGDERTLNALKDLARRPPLPRDPVPHDIEQFEPGECFSLDQELFLKNVRTARKGAAPGPSGMTADHLRPLVEHVAVAAALSQAASLLAQNKVPEEVMVAIRCGWLTALRKPDGGRGIVVGDVFRRVVARTIAMQIVDKVEEATSPHPVRAEDEGKLRDSGSHSSGVERCRSGRHRRFCRWSRSVRFDF